MILDNKFTIGDVVTFKTHPLLYSLYIKGDGKLVPPFMIVKEVSFEPNKKKTVDTSNGKIIAERIKYTCVFFDDNRLEFKEVAIYQSMLESYSKLYIARIDGVQKGRNHSTSLIEEVSKYENATYQYGEIVCFKTKKLELFKKRSSKKTRLDSKKNEKKSKEIIQYVVNHSTPNFILCGYKDDRQEGLFYPDGKIKKITPSILYKVKWFNSLQMKFSEEYLPMECFINEIDFTYDVKDSIKIEEKEEEPVIIS